MLFFSFLFIGNDIIAQDEWDCTPLISKKAKKKFEEAMELPKYKSKEAYQLLLEVIKLEPDFTEGLYILAEENWDKAQKAGEYARLKYYKRAANYFERVIETCPEFQYYYSYYYLGLYYYQYAKDPDSKLYNLDNCKNCIKYLELFIDKNQNNKSDLQKAQEIINNLKEYVDIMENPVPFEPKLVEGVSTKTDEFLPMISPDGNFLFYTHRFDSYDKYTTIQKEFEYFKFSHKIDSLGSLAFTSGENLPPPFNQGLKQGASSITIDNTHLFITICDFTDCPFGAYNNCDIYSSDYINGAWTEFKNLGPHVNGYCTWESQPSISADGKDLYFVSIREGNMGFTKGKYTSDIYVSHKDETGIWSRAKNIGPVINTEDNEKAPFLHSDSKTLYFSSDGRVGVGGYDIYFSKQTQPDEWTVPRNIGYPINTPDDDIGFMVSTDGTKAFLSSNKFNGTGGYDIYSFDLYKEARPEKVLFVKGQLIDDQGEPIQDAKIQMRSALDNRVIDGMVDKMTGKYAVAVSYNQNEEFIMTVKKKDYAFTSKYFRPTELKIEEPIEVEMELKPIETGTVVKLQDILFATNSAEFDHASEIILNSFIDFLKENPRLKIAIHGHTDNVGDPVSNMELSKQRANAVAKYLAENGIETGRMKWKGYGETRPVASNKTEEGRALNRRTEFVILEK